MESLHKRDRVLQDRAIELFIPPFAEMFAIPVLLGALSLGCGLALSWAWAVRLAVAWGVLLVLEAGYLFLGLKIARVPWSVAKAVVGAPLYIVWKFGVYIKMALQRSAGGWKRTERREL